MSDLDDSFKNLLGRQPSDAERVRLYRVRDALDLKKNDALWLLLIALEHYQTQYEKIPSAIADTAKDTLAHFKATADATVKASVEAAKADLAKAVAASTKEVANNVAGKEKLKWLSACIAATAITFGSFGWYMHTIGKESGFNAGHTTGYEKARNEEAAASWANTHEGQMAYRFAQFGEPAENCSLHG
jgi:hypothetical protein